MSKHTPLQVRMAEVLARGAAPQMGLSMTAYRRKYRAADLADSKTLVDALSDRAVVNALLEALRELEAEADKSLDYRPEFRRAISKAHTAIAKAEGQ